MSFPDERGAGAPRSLRRAVSPSRAVLGGAGGGDVVWHRPPTGAPPPAGGSYYPDDAFFIRHGTVLIRNREGNETLVELAFPSCRVHRQHRRPGVAGTAPGCLDNSDDAYVAPGGTTPTHPVTG